MFNKLKSIVTPVIIIVALGFLAGNFSPWWVIAIIAFIVGYFFPRTWATSFLYGFIAVSLLWGVYAATKNSDNGGIMSTSISQLFANALSATQLLYFTGVIGGLVGGFAAASGSLFKNLKGSVIVKQPERNAA